MSDAHPSLDPHATGEQNAHEMSDADIRPVLQFAAGLGALILVTMLLMAWLFNMFSARAARADVAPSPLEALRKPPEEPRLERSPPENLKAVRDEEDAL